MNERDWLTAEHPWPMLDYMRENAKDRKLRLFAVACCRRKWEYFTDERCRHAVEVAECFADDRGRVDDLARAAAGALEACNEWSLGQERGWVQFSVLNIAYGISRSDWDKYYWDISAMTQRVPLDQDRAMAAEARAQIQIVRDIFGNPFAPPPVDAAWLTSTVLALAHAIYDEKAFDRLPVLADALADAGCDNDDLLRHCRGDGPHVRGCWAVDLLLGRK